MSDEQKPTTESLIAFIQTEWADIHHSRVQEWTALGVVAGVHFALVQVFDFLSKQQSLLSPKILIITATFLAVVFAVFGGLITFSHRKLMRVKLNWIYQAEGKFGLLNGTSNDGIIPVTVSPNTQLHWAGPNSPRVLSTSGLIIGFYGLLILIDEIVAVFFGFLQ